MLIGINPILTGDLLKALSDMGHGDEIAIVDGNFAAASHAMHRPPIWVPTNDTIAVVKAILEVMPLARDCEFPPPIAFIGKVSMAAGEDITYLERPVHGEFMRTVSGSGQDTTLGQFGKVSVRDFRERVREAYAVVMTTDPRHYACFILRKGVLPDPAESVAGTSGPEGS
jgi:L-fucose mutarotase